MSKTIIIQGICYFLQFLFKTVEFALWKLSVITHKNSFDPSSNSFEMTIHHELDNKRLYLREFSHSPTPNYQKSFSFPTSESPELFYEAYYALSMSIPLILMLF